LSAPAPTNFIPGPQGSGFSFGIPVAALHFSRDIARAFEHSWKPWSILGSLGAFLEKVRRGLDPGGHRLLMKCD
jgi:hypothetical protein